MLQATYSQRSSKITADMHAETSALQRRIMALQTSMATWHCSGIVSASQKAIFKPFPDLRKSSAAPRGIPRRTLNGRGRKVSDAVRMSQMACKLAGGAWARLMGRRLFGHRRHGPEPVRARFIHRVCQQRECGAGPAAAEAGVAGEV